MEKGGGRGPKVDKGGMEVATDDDVGVDPLQRTDESGEFRSAGALFKIAI